MSGVELRDRALSEEAEAVLAAAHVRAKEQGVPYAGLVTPREADLLVRAGEASIVDVRTRFEAEYVGRIPNTPLVEWRSLGAPGPNPAFVDEVRRLPDQRERLLFLCRSGVRSHSAAAAMAAAGHRGSYNILEGFEGDLDQNRHRGVVGGWRRHGLPWIQN